MGAVRQAIERLSGTISVTTTPGRGTRFLLSLPPSLASLHALLVRSGGDTFAIDSHPLTIGRARNNDVSLPEDEYASGRHARFEPRRDGIWVEDIGSTNGTFVNGIRLTRERKLTPGDVVRIGETDLRFEP